MNIIRWILAPALILSFFASSFAVNDMQQDGIQQDRLDRYFNVLYENNRFMGSVVILSGDEIQYHYEIGYADLEQEIRINEQTRFRIASIGKPMTATLIMLLVEDGKLELNNLLSEFYPEFPNADEITIEHLLYHRSGLFNFIDDPAYNDWRTEHKTRDELLEILADHEPVFNPDEKMGYSNTNYMLLTFIAEDVSGQTFGDLLEQQIAVPIGLEYTYLGEGATIKYPEAYSYEFDGGWQQSTVTHMSIPLGAGGIVSTPFDVVHFARALFNGDLLNDHSLEAMTTLIDNAGMGLFHYSYYDKSGYGHTGAIDDFRTNLAMYPQDDLYIAITANSLSYPINDILKTLLDAWHGNDFSIPDFTTITLSEEHLRQFIGKYSSEDLHMNITLWVEDEILMAQANGQEPIPLDAESETRFRFDEAGLVFDFSEQDPEPTSFTLIQAGQQFFFEIID